ncbi:hypothetical protein [Huginn virus]|nr:hypothetical protein [Huginn virus]
MKPDELRQKILSLLRQKNEITLGELARFLGLSRETVARYVKDLTEIYYSNISFKNGKVTYTPSKKEGSQ